MPELRRIKVFYLPTLALQEFGREGITFRTVRGLPEGGRIVGVDHDLARDAFAIGYEHPSFEPVALNTYAPGEWLVWEATRDR